MLQVPAIRLSNPVLGKELRTRMRGNRAYWLLFWYVMLLSNTLICAYVTTGVMHAVNTNVVGADPIGRVLFQVLFVAQAVMLTMITPALTAGMITLEREQRTFELLMLTMLQPREVTAGKLLSAFGFAALLLTASLPLAGICFMMGGVSPGEIAAVYLMLASASLLYGALGLLVSATVRTTVVSTAATYMAVLGIFAVTAALAAGGRSTTLFAALNPVTAVFFSLELAPFYHWHVPVWIPSLGINLLAALLAAAGAVHRLEAGVSERPGALRWITYAFATALAICTVGSVLGELPRTTSPDGPREAAAVLASQLFVALALLTLFFCSGDAADIHGEVPVRDAPVAPGPLARLARSRLFTGGYASGPAYMLLLFLTGAVVMAAGFPLARHPAWVLVAGTILAALGVALSGMLFWMAMVRFFSIVMGSRLQAGLLAFLTAGVLMVLPLFSLFGWDASVPQPHRLAWETLYLTPAYAFLALGCTPETWKEAAPPLWAGQSLAWAITILLYVALAAIVEGGGQAVRGRQRARHKTRRALSDTQPCG
jgi:ABC-type transport system involved in multi-copper enzyme maturation permease subunit